MRENLCVEVAEYSYIQWYVDLCLDTLSWSLVADGDFSTFNTLLKWTMSNNSIWNLCVSVCNLCTKEGKQQDAYLSIFNMLFQYCAGLTHIHTNCTVSNTGGARPSQISWCLFAISKVYISAASVMPHPITPNGHLFS